LKHLNDRDEPNMNLYQEEILDHYKHPRNKIKLEDSTYSARAINALCGDNLSLDILIENGIISKVGFSGDGCAISQAAMSMLTEEISGKPQEILFTLEERDVLEMIGVPIGPARLKCALLCLNVIDQIRKRLI